MLFIGQTSHLNEFTAALDQALKADASWPELRKSWSSGEFPLEMTGPRGAWLAFILAKLAELTAGPILVVTPDEVEARSLCSDLELFTGAVSHFPWWGAMLYRGVSPQAAIFGRRSKVLAELASGERRIVVVPMRAALGLLPPPSSMQGLALKVGGRIDPVELEDRLQRYGYTRVPRVSVPGEFALRGEVLDFSPLGGGEAVRIVFGWDEVEEIRLFDPFTQASSESLDRVVIHPLREVLWEPSLLECLDRRFPGGSEALESLSTGRDWRGEELFYPLAFENPSTLQDYLNPAAVTVFLHEERLLVAEKGMRREYGELYERALEEGLSVPEPESLTVTLDAFKNARDRRMVFRDLRQEDHDGIFNIPCEPGRSFFGNISFMKEEFGRLREAGSRIFIFAESESQSQRISYLLREEQGVSVLPASLSAGFLLPQTRLLAVQENEIFARRRKSPDSLRRTKSRAIESFVDLEPGDLVVHVDHGIGRFLGIKRIKTAGAERDYITLEYAAEETLYIPIEQVNLIQRYIGREGGSRGLDRFGAVSWEKRKSRVKKSVADLADKLIELYARRRLTDGFAFPRDDDFQVSFEAAFPWEETPDQLTAIEDVKRDMESPSPMDRLICGDVGYGKTEIAMRAAFKAVMGGRQTIYLCPTTILAEQHHESFTERFKRFPVTVAMLSRFVLPAEQKRILEGTESGNIDIVIGTHRLLSRDVRFKNPGLMIIDEEQRFGVKDKERLKELKVSIDCLTLSATPIPRTLHMSLVKIRDMSLLETPPVNRQPIETFIQEFDPELVATAIRREVERDGQVFFLHNRVDSLERIQKFLHDLVPEVFVEVAHGQLSSRELEDIIHRFVHGAFQVLVSTTIIENGIDIPNVNTIIIDRADMYGISQLYQLRGRVGRSGRLAYAYLLYPHDGKISDLAMKRLQIVSDFTELGSGFKIAMKDLEVRGAGNLLGSQQTGDVHAVGFDLYLRLLEEAVRERMEEGKEEIPEPYLELDYSGFIPDGYIADETEKMEVYKKIAAVSDEGDLDHLHAELSDRFGPPPNEVLSLVCLAELRILCRKLRVTSLKERMGQIRIEFGKVAMISVDRVVKLTRETAVKLDPANPGVLVIQAGSVKLKEKSEFLLERLSSLLP